MNNSTERPPTIIGPPPDASNRYRVSQAIRFAKTGSLPLDAPSITDYRDLTPHPDRKTGGSRKTPGAPEVTLITCVRNGAKLLPATIESIKAQTYQDFEYIVIDGGSTDGTLDILRENDDVISTWVSEPDFGPYDAMNRGISRAKGKIVKIINGDDLQTPRSVELALAAHAKTDKPTLVRGNLIIINESGRELGIVDQTYVDGIQLPKEFPLLHPSWYLPLEVYRQLGLYSTRYRVASDWEYLLRLIENHVSFVHIDEPLVAFRTGGISRSSAGMWETLEINSRHLGLTSAALVFSRTFTKKSASRIATSLFKEDGKEKIRNVVKSKAPFLQRWI